MVRQLEQMQRDRHQRTATSSLPSRTGGADRGALAATHPHHPPGHGSALAPAGHGDAYECVALHVSPDLGERLMLSGERALLDEVRSGVQRASQQCRGRRERDSHVARAFGIPQVFPETSQAVMDTRQGAAWNQHDQRHVIRFPLNGYCKLNSVQAIQRLLNAGFSVVASNGGGVEGQQFSEYLFVRRALPPS